MEQTKKKREEEKTTTLEYMALFGVNADRMMSCLITAALHHRCVRPELSPAGTDTLLISLRKYLFIFIRAVNL